MKNEFYTEGVFSITVDGAPITTTSEGIYYNVSNNRLNIIFDNSVEPATYIVRIKFSKVGTVTPVDAGNLRITKRQGASAYLENIKFSEFVQGIEYPGIYAVNDDNTTTLQKLGIYSGGIDYNDYDEAGHQYFRIDGEVAGIPLNEYMPLDIVNYLPLGAKIQRKYYVNDVAEWTDLVDADSTEAEIIASLAADFTVDPKTGNLEFDTEGNAILPYIEYRIVSEDGENKVTYFISVRDIKYSFLAVFSYYYYDGTNYFSIDTIDAYNNKVLILNIYNYSVKSEGTELEADKVYDDVLKFPSFDEVITIQSTMTQFYYVVKGVTGNQYIYGLGTNFSGFYHFILDIDKEYIIYEGDYDDGEILPLMSGNIASLDGYYYYINSSPITRTRYFTVVITNQDIDDNTWGFTDYTKH